MTEYNITYLPEYQYLQDFQMVPTYNDVLKGMQNQLSDQVFYLSLILLSYILLNMFIFNEGARFRKQFDKLDEHKIEYFGSVRDITFQIVETFAFMGAMMFVVLNIMYRLG